MDLDIILDNDKRFIARCAAVIYNKDKTKVLMFNFKDYYMLPGGRIEFNETSLDAIKREIKEETGYDLKFTFQGVQENFLSKDNKDIIILDKTNNTKGLYTYNTFLLAGDTLWYKPVTLADKLYNYPMQNDSRFILSELSKKDKIQKLHNDSISWYNNLPNNIDLIITHVPPFRNKNNSRGNNSCYYTEVKEYKSPVWIYGHDHKEEDIIINNTRFVSNPWGYDTKEFKVKTLTLTK